MEMCQMDSAATSRKRIDFVFGGVSLGAPAARTRRLNFRLKMTSLRLKRIWQRFSLICIPSFETCTQTNSDQTLDKIFMLYICPHVVVRFSECPLYSRNIYVITCPVFCSSCNRSLQYITLFHSSLDFLTDLYKIYLLKYALRWLLPVFKPDVYKRQALC